MGKDIQIGKNVIEILTTGMYPNSRFIYREYIQNAADQIDIAIKEGLLTSKADGVIDIRIDASLRNIKIRDNATGIEASKVYELLGNVANSTKDRKTQKGFRGIGRLGGLAYCDTLVFETSTAGEPVKSIMTWDAQKMRSLLMDPKVKIDAVAVIKEITTLKKEPCDNASHFFSVEMQNVNKDSVLLKQDDIAEYLSMIAPVRFDRAKFYFCSKIYDFAKAEGFLIDEYVIRLNGEDVTKGYRQGIHKPVGTRGEEQRVDEVIDVEFVKFEDSSGKILAWGWLGVLNFKGKIPDCNIHKYIRLRKSNIQIGEENALSHLHKEPRGNGYFIGEIHAVGDELIPNSERSYFNENEECKELEREIRKYFEDVLYKLYYNANEIKNAVKRLEEAKELKDTITAKRISGFAGHNEEKKLTTQYETAVKNAIDGQRKLERFAEKAKENELLSRVFTSIVQNYSSRESSNTVSTPEPIIPPKKVFRTDKLTKLDKNQRKFLGNIFDIIHKVLPPDLAESLICKIEDEYK